jgi:hypothetical protein
VLSKLYYNCAGFAFTPLTSSIDGAARPKGVVSDENTPRQFPDEGIFSTEKLCINDSEKGISPKG